MNIKELVNTLNGKNPGMEVVVRLQGLNRDYNIIKVTEVMSGPDGGYVIVMKIT